MLKGHLLLSFIGLCLVLLYSGCSKTESIAPSSGVLKVKVYDDSLAEILNSSIHIASGSEIIYMTYGVNSSDNSSYVNTSVYISDNIYYAHLMASDLKGNLKWDVVLPQGRVVGDIMVLDNGSCIIASHKSYDTYYPQLRPYIFLAQYDPNGQKIREDSVYITRPGIKGYNTLHLSRSVNNNILISGEVVSGGGGGIPYLGEVDLNFDLLWDRHNYFIPGAAGWEQLGGFSNIKITPDGNYLMVRNFIQKHTGIHVIKTNPAGEVIWEKPFVTDSVWNTHCNDFIQDASGNFLFSFTAFMLQYSNTNNVSHLYTFDANGDSLKRIDLSINPFETNFALVPKSNGGVFALMNNRTLDFRIHNFSKIPMFDNINTSIIQLDADQNIISNNKFQVKTSDFLKAACKLPNDEIACFGLVQISGKPDYKPLLIILK